MHDKIIWFENVGMHDIDRVGGKNASLGEMINHLTKVGIQVPNGFATTAEAYHTFLNQHGLADRIYKLLDGLDVDDVHTLAKTGAKIRQWIIEESFPQDFEQAINTAFKQLQGDEKQPIAVAVRSSATAEDLPDASFAGQQETFLNIRGVENVKLAIKQVFASLFNDRAIAYRAHQGFHDHAKIGLSAGIQRMVRSDKASSGVMFTLDTESGFNDVVFITSAYGLGETIVQGAVNPDEFYVHKPTLAAGRPAILRRDLGEKAIKMIYTSQATEGHTITTVSADPDMRARFSITDDEVQHLARQAVLIEKHYGRPMDIEWAKDGENGQLYILQARPETVKSRQGHEHQGQQVLERYLLHSKGEIKAVGRSIGQRIGSGRARVIHNIDEMASVQAGDVLVADMTDPDWEPIMKRAAAIVTNRGGRTCHAAIIARELAIPAVVGCGDATLKIKDGDLITISCAEGDTGYVYEGLLDFEKKIISVETMPELPFKIMMNVGNPSRAFEFQNIPNAGVGLARLEFIINQMIGIHPKALLNYKFLSQDLQETIRPRILAYASPREFYIQKLREGIATLAAAFSPKPVIVRLSDFKSNEYANLIGGSLYEPKEENPMLGFRGAARYVSTDFRDCFAMECEALRQVRDEMGFTNVQIMVPFVRTVPEAAEVVRLLSEQGLERGKNGLKLIMMCEIPSNALLADEFLEHFDGFSIGSNDLTQLTLGLDRDSGLIAKQFDERDPAVKALLKQAIQACKKAGKYIGICGQGPSDHPDFAQWLMEQGIDTVSLNPDSVIETWLYLGKNKP
jgi:pyruvate, water dikinase